MATFTIELPDSLTKFLKRCIAEGIYRSESEYIQQVLAERELESQDASNWDALYPTLMGRVNEGHYFEATDDYWNRLEKRLADRRTDLTNSKAE